MGTSRARYLRCAQKRVYEYRPSAMRKRYRLPYTSGMSFTSSCCARMAASTSLVTGKCLIANGPDAELGLLQLQAAPGHLSPAGMHEKGFEAAEAVGDLLVQDGVGQHLPALHLVAVEAGDSGQDGVDATLAQAARQVKWMHLQLAVGIAQPFDETQQVIRGDGTPVQVCLFQEGEVMLEMPAVALQCVGGLALDIERLQVALHRLQERTGIIHQVEAARPLYQSPDSSDHTKLLSYDRDLHNVTTVRARSNVAEDCWLLSITMYATCVGGLQSYVAYFPDGPFSSYP